MEFALFLFAGVVLFIRALKLWREWPPARSGSAVGRRLATAGFVGSSVMIAVGVWGVVVIALPEEQSVRPLELVGLTGLGVALLVFGSIIPLVKKGE